jgi:hypothetical protein
MGGTAELSVAIDRLMPRADPELLVDLCREMDRLRANVALTAAAVEQSQVWAADGAASFTSWFAHHTARSREDANALRREGKRLSQLPVAAEAACDGTLSTAQVQAIVSNVGDLTVGLFAEHEAELVPTLAGLSALDARRACGIWRQRAEALVDGAEPKEPVRSFTFRDGVGKIIADSAMKVTMEQAIATASTFDAAGEERAKPRRNADALEQICEFWNENHAQAPDTHHRPHVEILIHVDDLETWGGATTSDGELLTPAVAAALTCDSVLHRVIHNGSRAMDYGRSERTAPEVTFRAVALRDGGCRYPGCDRPVTWCQSPSLRPVAIRRTHRPGRDVPALYEAPSRGASARVAAAPRPLRRHRHHHHPRRTHLHQPATRPLRRRWSVDHSVRVRRLRAAKPARERGGSWARRPTTHVQPSLRHYHVFGVVALATPSGSASAAVTVTSHFVYVTSAANTSGDTSYIVNGATNNQPNDLVFVTPNYNANGICGCVFESAPIGVWYNNSLHERATFREDVGAMPAGEAYNVLVVPPNKVGTSVFVQTSTTANTAGDFTLINNPLTNGQPAVRLEVTQNWDPGGVGGVYNNHNIGVWYDSAASEWGVFNEDLAAMPVGVSFNVLVGSGSSNGGQSTLLKASSANTSGDTVFISNSKTTGNPNNVVFATHNWNPNGRGGTYNNVQTGVWFDGSPSQEGVFSENESGPPLKSAYNLLIFSS